jgi:hypothetical protein
MLSITALLHTHNDAMRLGRCLETLYPCDDIVIVDHDSTDGTPRLAREYGARVLAANQHSKSDPWWRAAVLTEDRSGPGPRNIDLPFTPGWILCLDPRESVSESLAASLFELKSQPAPDPPPFSVFLREETAEGWVQHPAALTRLVPPTWPDWDENFPQTVPSALVLEGDLLRFVFP